MKSYKDMSCGELKRIIDQIDTDLTDFPNMSQIEKDRLTYERMQANGILLRKIAAILDECEEEA